MTEIRPTTEADLEIIATQLGRVPYGVLGIAAHCNLTTPPNATHAAPHPAVIATASRLSNGEPFPTFYYLTCPTAVAACPQLETADVMRETEALLDNPQHPGFRLAYHQVYWACLATRRVASPAPIPEIANSSAGGMPDRVKCFHALLGHALAVGLGVNPVGNWALARLRAGDLWSPETCDWHPEP